LAAKVAGQMVMQSAAVGELLVSCQWEYGVKDGVEAAVHAVRLYLRVSNLEDLLVKYDFSNALYNLIVSGGIRSWKRWKHWYLNCYIYTAVLYYSCKIHQYIGHATIMY
jgi:hypothetical protein